jgi:hypothetical protein
MPPIIQRMALLMMAARMSKTTPRMINVYLPRSETRQRRSLPITVLAITRTFGAPSGPA